MPKFIEIRENEKEISKISNNAISVLSDEHGIEIPDPKAIATIVHVFMAEAVNYMNEHKSKDKDFEINLLGMLDLGVAYRENGEAEKEGNYTPYARPGHEFKLGIKDDSDTEIE